MSDFQHAVPAERAPRETYGPTDEELAAINDRIALTPQVADDLFVWSFVISNNSIDSHGTWMDRSSLENYAAQASGARGVPYLRHHNSYTDERGRVFNGELFDTVSVPEQPQGADPSRVIPTAREVFRPITESLTLAETAFMLRGLTLNGTPNDDLIRNLEAGVSASNSIGFSVYVPTAPGSYLECDICEQDLFAKDGEGHYLCPHYPGVDYHVYRDDVEYHVVATARVVNATQREASGVYLGSTPGTFTLAARGRDLYETGRASKRDARMMEDVLHLQRGMVTMGRPEVGYSLPAAVTTPTGAIGVGTAIPDTATPATEGRESLAVGDDMGHDDVVARVRELLGTDPDRLAAVELADVSLETDPVGALARVYDDELAEAIADRDEATETHQEFKRVVRERLALADGEDIAAGIDRVMADVAVAREFKGDLVAELLRQMTRAGLKYDEAEQKTLGENLSVAQLRAQADMYRDAGNRLYPPGRVTEPKIEERRANSPAHTATPATAQG